MSGENRFPLLARALEIIDGVWWTVREARVFVGVVLFSVAFLTGLVLVAAALSERSCAAEVAGSPVVARWSFFGGCQIRDAAGVWVALEQYHAVAVQ